MVEVLRSNFIRTARAKGLRRAHHHASALHAGLLPLVSYLGPAIADIVSARLSSSRFSPPASADISCRPRSTAITPGDGVTISMPL